ncbi:MAG: tetratricopeptide repeat protein [Candidatus Sulfotelmatobacter sp.]
MQINLAVCGLLALVTFAVYLRSAGNPFSDLDDKGYVTENRHVQQGLTQETLRWALTSTTASNWHPLTWLSHALDCELFGLDPAGHHLMSVLFHVLNAMLLFLLLARSTGAKGRSFLVAAIFALHPINVESVAWVAERKNVLSMFFFLLTLAAYGWYARRPQIGRSFIVALLFILGLAAKPMIVTLPFVLLLVDFWPLQRVLDWQSPSQAFPVPQLRFRRLVLEKSPFLLLALASSAVTMIAQKNSFAIDQNMKLPVRLANALYAYSMYVAKFFWPVHLAPYYPYEGLRLSPWHVLLCALFLAAVTLWVWWERSQLYVPVGWLLFLGTLIPMIGLVQVGDQAMADRYSYLPLVGILVLAVWRAADFAQSRKLSLRICALAGGVLVTILSFLTWRQIGYWHSSYELWSHTLAVTKENYLAEDFIGMDLLEQGGQAGGGHYADEALAHFQNAVRINPMDAIGHLDLGAALQGHGQLQEAIQQYRMALAPARDPHVIVMSLTNLAMVYSKLGDFTQARQYYGEVLKREPHNQFALAHLEELNLEERIQALDQSVSAHPSPKAYLDLGQLQEAAGQIAEARASYREAVKLDPKSYEGKMALSRLGGETDR